MLERSRCTKLICLLLVFVAGVGVACRGDGVDPSASATSTNSESTVSSSPSATSTVREPLAEGLPSTIPPPDYTSVLPDEYRTDTVYYAWLTGGETPDIVITSVGPRLEQANLHPADLQVLAWDATAERWTTIFDAQEVDATPTGFGPLSTNAWWYFPTTGNEMTQPIAPPDADVSFGEMSFIQLSPNSNNFDLLFTTYVSGGADVTGGDRNRFLR